MTHCNMVADNICSQAGVKNNADFSKYLTVATDMFFTLTNDEDADIRLLADECLTRVVKNLSESGNNIARMQVELYKEIKKNGSSRSLRSAISKFAAVCDQIRPKKGRAYIENLTPCFVKIANTRKEEQVHETLAENMSKILQSLGHYATETEIDALLSNFLPNLSHNSASIRRSTASILASIVENSRKPAHFSLWLFKTIIENCIPCQEPKNIPSEKLLGLMVGTRSVIPLIAKYEPELEIDASEIVQKSLQLYELCLYLTDSKDASVIAQSLETLQELLKNPSNIFKGVLISPLGISSHSIFCKEDRKKSGEEKDEIFDNVENLEDHEESLPGNFEKGRIKLMDSIDETPRQSVSENFEEEEKSPDQNRPKSATKSDKKEEIKGNLGSFLDKDVPLIYCSRKLCTQFLLSPSKGDLIKDSKVRVSTKALAIGCLTKVVKMSPKVFLLTLYSDVDEEDVVTILIRDVANFIEHDDPQLRGSVVLLLGQVLKGALIESGGDLELWYNGRRPNHLDTLNILQNVIGEEVVSAITIKHILTSALTFLPLLLNSIHSRSSIQLLKVKTLKSLLFKPIFN